MKLRSKLNFIDAIVSKFNMAWLKSNLNNTITSISILSNNSSKTKICKKKKKNYYRIFKIMKTIFFDSETHLTCYTNMRLKTTLIPFVGKTHGKYCFISHTKTHNGI